MRIEPQSRSHGRRIFGVVFGSALGLSYGLVSQLINIVLIPGVPLYQPPFGAFGNILLSAALGTLLGAVTSWPDDSIVGVVWGSLGGGLAVTIASVFTGSLAPETMMSKLLLLVLLDLPISGACALFVWLIRSVYDRQFEAQIEGKPLWRRLLLPTGLVVAIGALGLFDMLPPAARPVLVEMNQMVQAACSAASAADLPAPLRPPDVNSLLDHACPSYELEWKNTNLSRYAIPAPAARSAEHALVAAHFADGWQVACLFPYPGAEVTCRAVVKHNSGE